MSWTIVLKAFPSSPPALTNHQTKWKSGNPCSHAGEAGPSAEYCVTAASARRTLLRAWCHNPKYDHGKSIDINIAGMLSVMMSFNVLTYRRS